MPPISRQAFAQGIACALLPLLLASCATPPPVSARGPTDPSQLAVPTEARNLDVRQTTIASTICVPGYTASVRPSTSYTNGVKAKLLREHGLPPSDAPNYELDHRLSLSIGGHPRALVNLALQPWNGQDGAKKKDQLERRLQSLVCSGKVQLDVAQRAMFWDWQAAFRKYMPGG